MTREATGPISLRERQKAQTREHLLDAAAGLIAERGFGDTTMDDIARAAGSSRATVYAYFATKDDILRTLAVEMWEDTEDLYRAFAALPEWSPAAIRGWIEDVAAVWDRTSVRTRAVVESMSRELGVEYLDYHRRYVRTLTGDETNWKRFSPEEAEIRAHLLITQLETFLGNWYIRGWEMDRATAIETLADVWCATLKVG
jgi:AcrR family transcriptional regulator